MCVEVMFDHMPHVILNTHVVSEYRREMLEVNEYTSLEQDKSRNSEKMLMLLQLPLHIPIPPPSSPFQSEKK